MGKSIWSINSAENLQFRASVDGSGTDGAAGRPWVYSGHRHPCLPTRGLPTGQPQPPPSRPWRRPTLYSLCHSLALVAGPAFCPATSHLRESEAAEMCTTDGKNYGAHLTSEIFSFFLLSPFFYKLLQDWGKLIDSVCKWALKFYKEDLFFFFQQSQLW